MNQLDELLGAAVTEQRLRPCKLVTATKDQPEDVQETLDKALRNRAVYSAEIIGEALNVYGVKVSTSVIRQHRNYLLGEGGACVCQRNQTTSTTPS